LIRHYFCPLLFGAAVAYGIFDLCNQKWTANRFPESEPKPSPVVTLALVSEYSVSAAIRQQWELLWQNQGKRQIDSGQPQDRRLDNGQNQASGTDEKCAGNQVKVVAPKFREALEIF
jgi:hypothetical protein